MDSDDDCWEEPMNDGQDVPCLFCNSSFQSTNELWEHCKVAHQFDIAYVKQKCGKLTLLVKLSGITEKI